MNTMSMTGLVVIIIPGILFVFLLSYIVRLFLGLGASSNGPPSQYRRTASIALVMGLAGLGILLFVGSFSPGAVLYRSSPGVVHSPNYNIIEQRLPGASSTQTINASSNGMSRAADFRGMGVRSSDADIWSRPMVSDESGKSASSRGIFSRAVEFLNPFNWTRIVSHAPSREFSLRIFGIPFSRSLTLDLVHFFILFLIASLWQAWSRNTP